MRRKKRRKKTRETYSWWNLGDGGKEEPNDTLAEQKARQCLKNTMAAEKQTCFHMRCARQDVPPP